MSRVVIVTVEITECEEEGGMVVCGTGPGTRTATYIRLEGEVSREGEIDERVGRADFVMSGALRNLITGDDLRRRFADLGRQPTPKDHP